MLNSFSASHPTIRSEIKIPDDIIYMCYNCGCYNPQDDMGDLHNITEHTFAHLAAHNSTTIKQTKQLVYQQLERQLIQKEKTKEDSHLTDMYQKAAKAWGQSIDEARKNTYQLLKSELKK
jgi:hypothetical protein